MAQHVLNQRREDWIVHRREPYQTRVQPLKLALGHRVEIDATNALVDTRALQPTKENLGSTRIGDHALAQTTLDLRVRRGLTATAGCEAVHLGPGPWIASWGTSSRCLRAMPL